MQLTPARPPRTPAPSTMSASHTPLTAAGSATHRGGAGVKRDRYRKRDAPTPSGADANGSYRV